MSRREDSSGPPDPQPSTPNSEQPSERFRWWAILLGAVLIPVNSLWIARAEALDYSGFPTCMSLFYNVIFTLMALVVLNAGIRRLRARWALTRPELIVVYGMVATGSSLVGHDYLQMLVPTIPHVAYFASPSNNWEGTIAPLLPEKLAFTQLNDGIKAYELGYSTLYTREHLMMWLEPMALWSIFILSGIIATLSLSLLLRRQWIEHERLTYPIVQLPVMVTENGGANRIFRSKLFWSGFSIAAGLDLLNGLAYFYPSLPSVNVKVQDVGVYFAPYPPWNALGWLPLSFYPFAIGLSFFMPTNLGFSSWFFYFVRKMQNVAVAAMGYAEGDPWYPYLKEQSYGAWIALFVATLWLARGYIGGIVRTALRDRTANDGGVSYRLILASLAMGIIGMIWFLIWAGMTPSLAIVYVILYMLFCGAAARVRAEVGPPSHEVGWVGNSYMMIMVLGTAAVGPKNLALFSLLHFQNRMHRGLLMPQQAESLKAASDSGLRIRVMAAALALAGLIGIVAAFWAMLHLSYGRTYATRVHPAAPGSAFAAEHFNRLAQWLSTPVLPNQAGLLAILIGALIALALAWMSVSFHGFPFHPAGYALGMSFGLDYIWTPIFIAWLAKVIILRWWGLKGYRAAIPFFIGLVIGEFTVGGMWSFVRGVLGVQTYTFYIW